MVKFGSPGPFVKGMAAWEHRHDLLASLSESHVLSVVPEHRARHGRGEGEDGVRGIPSTVYFMLPCYVKSYTG